MELRLSKALDARRERQMLRSLDPIPGTTELVDFSSNDYLSLARSRSLRQKYVAALTACPPHPVYGPPSSRLLDGNSSAHLALEDHLAQFLCGESALLFNSGFDANVGLWSVLPGPNDWIVLDTLIHASTHDGVRACRVPKDRIKMFKHNDPVDLERLLREIRSSDSAVREGSASVWLGVETVYSMDGTLCRLTETVAAAERVFGRTKNCHVVVDEAHSTGTYGPNGRGLVCALGLAHRVAVRLHTFGKAMACSGAVVLATPLIRSYLINYARPLIYSTVMPYINVLAIATAFEFLEDGLANERSHTLHALAAHFVATLSTFLSSTSHPLSIPSTLVPTGEVVSRLISSPSAPMASNAFAAPLEQFSTESAAHGDERVLVPVVATTPIIPLLTATPRPLAAFLRTKGYLVRPITYPTVPRGEERVRVCIHAGNTVNEVEGLALAIKEWCDRPEHQAQPASL